ncbi:pyridoxal 5'-phosphate synthase [Lysobacter sp. 1R34A]|uniref:pyridoxal 5'-phosphate synthase n=1 Tax=Lysobacter sp. 1R34A TaxID=3445786 RepID=UPI003EE9FBE1
MSQFNATSAQALEISIFDVPPEQPIPLLREWFNQAIDNRVRDPGTLALATTGIDGRASNRMVHLLEITGDSLVFTTHAKSQKGREIAFNGWASGVLYWRETKQQIVLSGPVGPLSAAESDLLWSKRPPEANSMSTVSRQSAVLEDEKALRLQAQRLTRAAIPLVRPEGWHGYALRPTIVEFWQASDDRLHSRLRYDAAPSGWTHRRLQP